MQTLKSVFGVTQALVPVIYCGGLVYYFFGVGGSIEGAETIGLGPTIVGLGAVGLLFCIPLILKLMRLFAKARPPGSGDGGSAGDDGFDADAVIARYMARQSTQAASNTPAAPPRHDGGGEARRTGFGRKIN